MAAAFYQAGFNVFDITMNDIINNKINLDILNGIAFVGGFTYKDILGSANGWYSVIDNNDIIKKQFNHFYNKKNTFSLGICNGCQLMIKLGLIDSNIKIVKNKSNRFESRFSTVTIHKSSNIFLKDMFDLNFGVWVSNTEGQFQFIITNLMN